MCAFIRMKWNLGGATDYKERKKGPGEEKSQMEDE